MRLGEERKGMAMGNGSMTSDWYYVKHGGPGESIAGRQVGPFTWEQLFLRAEAGEFGPNDLVWNPQLPDWFPAARVPGLFAAVAQPATDVQTTVVRPAAPPEPIAAAQPVAPPDPFAAMEITAVRPAGDQPVAAQPTPYQPAAYQPPTYQPPMYPLPPEPRPPRRRRSWLLPVLIPLITLIVVGGGLGAYFGIWYDGNGPSGGSEGSTVTGETTATTRGDTIELGTAEFKAPDLTKLVESPTWGEVPANEICVTLVDGKSRGDAEDVAQALGGSVVGEIEYINLYQIETGASTEAELQAALDQAASLPEVESAFANQELIPDTEIWGVRQSPLNDPAYGQGRDGGFKLIGAQKAWSYIKGSGLPLSEVHVGLTDSGIFKGTGEFDGDSHIYFPDQTAGELTSPNNVYGDTGEAIPDPRGSHGTMTSGMVGGDPEDGGTTGLASPPLDGLLTVSHVNISNQYDVASGTPVAPDPDDPTVVQWSDGKSYSLGGLAALAAEVEAGAKVINCSWSSRPPNETAEWAAAYQQFFEKMSQEHPDVLFVCSAGNTGWTNPIKDGATTWPGGRNLPNMITVGNVKNDGTRWQGSTEMNTQPEHEYEVTLAAPGHEAVQGVDANGNPLTAGTKLSNGFVIPGGGTSMAAPQVTAAAALLLGLDPELTAGEIKQILSDTARPGPAELGGKILAVDLAVLEVINQRRERLGLPAVTAEELEKGGVIDAVAISQDEPNVWMVKAIVESLPSVEGAEITITATTGTKIEGETSQKIDAPGEVVWIPVTVPNEVAEITVTRQDSGASSVITFEQIDLNGYWTGSLTITDVTVDPDAAPTEGEEGCSLALVAALMDKLKGMPIPLTMEITVDETGNGTAVMTMDMASVVAQLGEEGEGITAENEPQTIPFTLAGNTLTFQPEAAQGAMSNMTGTVKTQGDTLVIDGTLSSSGTGFSIKAVWTVTQE